MSKQDPDTGEEVVELLDDTPLLINIKGCGYPPAIDCDIYAETFANITEVEMDRFATNQTTNPWWLPDQPSDTL